MPRAQEPKPAKPIPVTKLDYLPPGSSDPTTAARKGMLYGSERWPDNFPPEAARSWLSFLRANVVKREEASPQGEYDALSDKRSCEQTRAAIDALLVSVQGDNVLGLVCDLAIHVHEFTVIEGDPRPAQRRK
jgi:hypothetical protein